MAETMSAAAPDDVTDDYVLDGQVQLRQPRKGYRAGLDAALLAAACDAAPGMRVLEAGCGVGGALLAAAVRRPTTLFVGLERDPQALALAQTNIACNGLGDRVWAQQGDVTQGFQVTGHAPFDAVLANPPYFDDPAQLRPPHPTKTAAWIAEGGLKAWTAFLVKAVREQGTITVIHRADRLGDLLELLSSACGGIAIRPVHPFPVQPAKRVLVRAIKASRAPLRLLPPLILQGDEGLSAQTDALLRGRTALSWS